MPRRRPYSSLAVLAVLAGLAVSALIGPGAHAQDAAPDVVQLDTVEVVGQRLSQQRSADVKQAADGIVDAVSADDIGRLPDKNAAEALDRLPGISITVDQGEGRYVSIRGIDPTLNNMTIDGVNAGSPESDQGGRLVPLDVISGDLLSRIEVVKVQTPDMDAQGIGGTINIVSKGPFDYREPLTAQGSMQLGYDSLNDKLPYAAQATLSGLSRDRHWGWLVGGSWQHRDAESRGIYQDNWGTVTDEDTGVSASLPENTKNTVYGLERERMGANAQLEWRPAERQRLWLRGFYSRFSEDEERQRYQYFFHETVADLDEDGSGSSGDDNRRTQDLRLEEKDKRFANLALGGELGLGRWTADAVAQLNDNHQTEPNRVWTWRADVFGPASWTLNDKGLVDFEPGPVDTTDASLLPFYRYTAQDNETTEDGRILALNLRRDLGDGGSYLKFGGKYTRTRRHNDASNDRYDPGSAPWTLADFGLDGGSFTNHVDGLHPPGMQVDTDAANALIDESLEDPAYFVYDAESSFTAEYAADYSLTEEIAAGYTMFDWRLGDLSLIPGVRFEDTSVASDAYQLEGETATPTSDSGGYHNWLPALIARYDIADWTFRAAYTETLGRPDYDQIAPIAELSGDASEATLAIGNPNLKARQSRNYDLSAEWYFARGDYVSLSLFYKDIKDQIVSRIDQYSSYDYGGTVYDSFEVETYENAESAKLRGAEVAWQQQLGFLPSPWDGLGLAVSYALLDSETHLPDRDDELPLPRQPDWTRSGTLFYQKGPVQLAVTLSQADDYLSGVSDDPETDLYMSGYGRLDAQASYAIGEHWSIFVQGQNLNDEPTIEYQGGDHDQKTQYEEYGRTFYVGVSARL